MRPYFFIALILFTSLISTRPAMTAPQDKTIENVSVTQKLGATIPKDLPFINENGETIKLGELLTDRPTFLIPVYYECPMLCSLVLNGFLKTIQRFSLQMGRDFGVITYSFDPVETHELAKKKKHNYAGKYANKGDASNWHFLTGNKESITALNDAIGFEASYDAESKRYAHAATVLLLTPEGRIANYFAGIEFNPRDFRLAIVEASDGKIGNAIDFIILTCFHYDPATGKYGLIITRVIRAGGILTVLLLVSFIALNLKSKKASV